MAINYYKHLFQNPFCAKVLLNEEDRMFFYTKLRNKNLTYTMRKKVFKEVHAKAKKVQICPFCSDIVGQVKKNGILKISYDRYRYKKPGAEAESKLCEYYYTCNIYNFPNDNHANVKIRCSE